VFAHTQMALNIHSAIEHFCEAVLILNRHGYISYTNPAARKLLGYQDQELLNEPFSIIYGEKFDSIRAEYELRTAIVQGNYTSYGWKSKNNGERFWGEIIISPVYEDNTLSGYSCLLRDTSEHKQRELQLTASEQKYRLMVDSVRDYAIFLLDTTGHIVTWNDGASLLKGYSSGEIIGKHFSIFYTEVDLKNKKPENELRIAIETGKYQEEGWRVKKNGSLFWANIVITALFDEHNQHIGFSKVTRDLTQRKMDEEELKLSEERYRSLVEQVTDYGIFLLDEKGRVISWNEGARRISGYEANEIIGKYFSIFYPEEDIINGKPAYELRVARKDGKFEEEGWRLRKDGARFWSNVVITAVYNSEGILAGFSKVTRDLTERKKAEKALRDSYERYRNIANELKAANEELSYANEELEQFTSIVSHDLQEPIRTIKSFLQLIDMKIDQQQTDSLKTYINKSINAANRMRELIQNLLHYSQLARGEIVEENVNVNELLNHVLQNIKTSIESSGAQVVIENNVSFVYGDRIQLTQLLQNLISNALKFTSAQRPLIRIQCYVDNGHPKFAISDNGIGIADKDLEKVFEIFRRLDTNNKYPGTGIGLAICKKIVERHNGRIWPVSLPGKGTTFYFTLNENVKATQSLAS
jgi:PAS domain S-box-containing protein